MHDGKQGFAEKLCASSAVAGKLPFRHNVHMAKRAKKLKKAQRPGHFIREWRELRGLTLERVAERIDLTHGTLSRIERGLTAYTQPVLEALADALGTTAASLIMRNPSKAGSIWDILEQIPPADRDNAAKALAGFMKKTGTDG